MLDSITSAIGATIGFFTGGPIGAAVGGNIGKTIGGAIDDEPKSKDEEVAGSILESLTSLFTSGGLGESKAVTSLFGSLK